MVNGSSPFVMRHRPLKRCPCCNEPGGFCEAHRAVLARIRGEYEEEFSRTKFWQRQGAEWASSE